MVAAFAVALSLLAAPPPPAGRKLSVVQAVLHHRSESAPAIPAGYRYIGGELIYFSFRVAGYQVKNDKVSLRWLIFATDPGGRLLWEPINGAIGEEVSHNDENWLPKVSQILPLPPQLPPGPYKLNIKATDVNAETSTELSLDFAVGGNPIPSPPEFSILNPAFYRDERDPSPMTEAVYKPGETLILKFQLAGFAVGEKNRFEVEYGIKVLRPSGREMYAEPRAAAESDSPYYPKRVMNGTVSLNLSSDLTPGEYSIVIAARDLGGQKTAESRVAFKVEK